MDRRFFFVAKKRTDGQTIFFRRRTNIFFPQNTNARHFQACGKYTLYRPNQPKNAKTLIVNVFRTPILVYQLSARVNIAQEVHKRIQFFSHLLTSNV